jgi:hypothetical protein
VRGELSGKRRREACGRRSSPETGRRWRADQIHRGGDGLGCSERPKGIGRRKGALGRAGVRRGGQMWKKSKERGGPAAS